MKSLRYLTIALLLSITITACGDVDENAPPEKEYSEGEEILDFNPLLEQGLKELDKVE